MRATAGQDVSRFVCGGDETVDIVDSAEGLAFVIAEAFASVVAQCETYGSASARAQAFAFAQDRAEAIGEAVAGVWGGIETCDNCQAVAQSFVRVSKFMIAEAVAEAWTEVRPWAWRDHTFSRLLLPGNS